MSSGSSVVGAVIGGSASVSGSTSLEYSIEKTKDLLITVASGMSADSIPGYGNYLQKKIDGHDFAPAKFSVVNGKLDKLAESALGRQLFCGATIMLNYGGPAMFACAMTDYPLDRHLVEIRKLNIDGQVELSALEREVVAVVPKPDEKMAEYRCVDKIDDERRRLLKKSRDAWSAEWTTSTPKKDSKQKAEARQKVAFEDSEHYKRFMYDIAEFEEETRRAMRKSLILADDRYTAHMEKLQVAKGDIEIRKDLAKKGGNNEVILSALQLALARIGQKIKSVAKEYPSFAARLKGRVRLVTGAIVSDPLGTDNVAGMYRILYHVR